jgi:hypothetical protein
VIAWLDRLATGRAVAALLVIDLALFASVNLLSFPLSVPDMKALTGASYLDMCALCSADDVIRQLAGFGDAGRAQQLRLAVSLDIAIPLVTCAFGTLALVRFTRGHRRWPIYLPALAAVLDLAENAAIVALIRTYPDVPRSLAAAQGWICGAKFVAYAVTAVAVVSAAARYAARRRRRSPHR